MPSLGKFIGGIRFGVSMDTKRLDKNIKSTRMKIRTFTGAGTKAFLGLAGAATAATAALTAVTKVQFGVVDSLAKTSDKLGVTTEKLAAMRHAADLTGVGANTLDMALQRMTRRTSEAAVGTGEARGAIRELGIDAKRLASLSPDKQFGLIADRMKDVSSQSDRVRLAFKLFDSEGVALVNTLNLGSKGLRGAELEARQLGLTVSRFDASKIEAANDAITRMKGAFAGVGRSLAVAVAPTVKDLADQTQRWLSASNDIKGTLSGSADIRGGFLGQVADIVDIIKDGFLGLRHVVTKSISFVVRQLDRLAKFIGADGGFLSAFNEELERASVKTFKSFNDSFTAKTPSERIASSPHVASVGPSPEKQADLFGAFKGAGKNLFGGLQNQLAGIGQIGDGLAASPVLQLLKGAFGAQLALAGAGGGQAGPSRQISGRSSLSFSRTGSAESFRNQAENRRIRENQKRDLERNMILQQIRDNQASNAALAEVHF